MPDYPTRDPDVTYGYFVDTVEPKVGFGKVYGERSFNNCLVAPEPAASPDLAPADFDADL